MSSLTAQKAFLEHTQKLFRFLILVLHVRLVTRVHVCPSVKVVHADLQFAEFVNNLALQRAATLLYRLRFLFCIEVHGGVQFMFLFRVDVLSLEVVLNLLVGLLVVACVFDHGRLLQLPDQFVLFDGVYQVVQCKLFFSFCACDDFVRAWLFRGSLLFRLNQTFFGLVNFGSRIWLLAVNRLLLVLLLKGVGLRNVLLVERGTVWRTV